MINAAPMPTVDQHAKDLHARTEQNRAEVAAIAAAAAMPEPPPEPAEYGA